VTRIIGGAARGRRLRVPTDGTRPTSDRAREALFSSIESIRGAWNLAHVLDLYAGSGACGLEAASRGAARVDLVEVDAKAHRVIVANRDIVLSAGIDSEITTHRASVERWVKAMHRSQHDERYDVVFCDPPYATSAVELDAVLQVLVASAALEPGSLIVVERSAHDPTWRWSRPLRARWDRKYGEAHLWVAAR
jgi:16S rRNA (guanine966-N2)-methyltransferase